MDKSLKTQLIKAKLIPNSFPFSICIIKANSLIDIDNDDETKCIESEFYNTKYLLISNFLKPISRLS